MDPEPAADVPLAPAPDHIPSPPPLPPSRPVPPPLRALALIGALLLFAYVAAPAVEGALDEPIVAAARALVLFVFLPPLLWVGVAPDSLNGILRRKWRIDLANGRHATGVVIQYLFALAMFGLLTFITTAASLQEIADTGERPSFEALPSGAIIVSLVVSVLLFAAATFSWLMLVKGLDGRGSIRALGLDPAALPAGALWGTVGAFGILLAAGGLALAAEELGIPTENPQAEDIAANLDLRGAAIVALLAGVGEELYFRGLLLPRVGNLAQAALFGVLHASYLTPLQVVLPFLFGFVFGWLRRRASLWAAIIAHALFDLVALVGIAALGEDASAALAMLLG